MALHQVKPRVFLTAILGLGLLLVIAACQPAMDTSDNSTGPDVSANADVDSSGTLLLQQMLSTMYPNQIFVPRLEADLKRRAYDCGPDPADATRRACLSSVKDGPCEVHTIIPTKPYAPNKAQVIRICAATPS